MDSLAEIVRHQTNRRDLDVLKRGLDQATQPWKMHRAIVYSDFDIVEGVDRVTIESRYGVKLDQIFYHRMPVPSGLSRDELLLSIISSYAESFRSWREIEPEQNITLGDN